MSMQQHADATRHVLAPEMQRFTPQRFRRNQATEGDSGETRYL